MTPKEAAKKAMAELARHVRPMKLENYLQACEWLLEMVEADYIAAQEQSNLDHQEFKNERN